MREFEWAEQFTHTYGSAAIVGTPPYHFEWPIKNIPTCGNALDVDSHLYFIGSDVIHRARYDDQNENNGPFIQDVPDCEISDQTESPASLPTPSLTKILPSSSQYTTSTTVDSGSQNFDYFLHYTTLKDSPTFSGQETTVHGTFTSLLDISDQDLYYTGAPYASDGTAHHYIDDSPTHPEVNPAFAEPTLLPTSTATIPSDTQVDSPIASAPHHNPPKRHRKRIKDEHGLFLCPSCDKKYKSGKGLYSHWEVKHGPGRIKCELGWCSKTYTQRNNMVRHMRKAHGSRVDTP